MPVSRSKQKESIDERILRIIGLEDIFDIDYETYLTLLKEAMVKARMPKTKLSSEESDLLLDEFKRVRSKKDKGRFEVKKKKISTSALRGSPAGRKTAQSRPVRQLSPARKRSTTADSTATIIAQDKEKYSPQLQSDVASILTSVTSILVTLKSRQKFLQNRSAAERRKLENEKRSKRESGLEQKKFTPLKKVAEKIFRPIKNILGGILDFFVNMFLARIFIKFINWMADPENRKKLVNTFRFLSNFWPVFAAAALGFGTGLVGFAGKLITTLGGLTLRLLSLAPRLAAVARFGKFGKLGAAAGLFTFGAWGPAMFPGLVNDDEKGGMGFSGGGLVPGVDFSNFGYGFGPVGTDTVSAMLTPGEFVMSSGAVDLIGADTLAYLNSLGGGTNKPRNLKGITYASGGGYINRRNRASGFGSPPGGYKKNQSRGDSDLVKMIHKYVPGARHFVGNESTLNRMALERSIKENTRVTKENTAATRENTRATRNSGSSTGSGGGFVGGLIDQGLGIANYAQNDLLPGLQKNAIEIAKKINPLPGIGRLLSSIAEKPYIGEEGIDKLTKERIASGELGEDGLGLTKTTQKNLNAHDAYIRSLYDPDKDTGFMGGLKKMNQTIQNRGFFVDPLAALGLKEEGTEKFIEKVTGGRVKNFGAKLTGIQMAAKGLAGPLGRMFQIDDRGSLGRYLRPAMEEAQRQGHTSVGARALGQEKYDELVGDKLANLALGQINFEVDEQGRAKTSDVFDASAMTPKQYLEASRSSLSRAGNILQGKEEGGLMGIGKALYQSAFMGLSGRLATAQNTGFGNLRPMGLDIDLGGGFTPKKKELSEKEKQSSTALLMGGKDAYYSSTTKRYYKSYADALKDPAVAAGARKEELKKNPLSFANTQSSSNRSAPPPIKPRFDSSNVTVVNSNSSGGTKPGDPAFIGPVPGNDPPPVKATPSGWDWARQQVMNVLGMGG